MGAWSSSDVGPGGYLQLGAAAAGRRGRGRLGARRAPPSSSPAASSRALWRQPRFAAQRLMRVGRRTRSSARAGRPRQTWSLLPARGALHRPAARAAGGEIIAVIFAVVVAGRILCARGARRGRSALSGQGSRGARQSRDRSCRRMRRRAKRRSSADASRGGGEKWRSGPTTRPGAVSSPAFLAGPSVVASPPTSKNSS